MIIYHRSHLLREPETAIEKYEDHPLWVSPPRSTFLLSVDAPGPSGAFAFHRFCHITKSSALAPQWSWRRGSDFCWVFVVLLGKPWGFLERCSGKSDTSTIKMHFVLKQYMGIVSYIMYLSLFCNSFARLLVQTWSFVEMAGKLYFCWYLNLLTNGGGGVED